MELIFANIISIAARQAWAAISSRASAASSWLARALAWLLRQIGRLLTRALVATLGRFFLSNY